MSANTPSPSLQTGLAHHQAGRLQEAAAIYAAIPESSTNFAQATYLLGILAQDHGEHANAITYLTRASALRPAEAVIHFQAAVSYSQLGQFTEAASCYQQALALNPKYVEAHCNLGNLLKRTGDTGAAIACYTVALKLAPQAAQIHYNLGVCYQDQFKPEQAIACFRNAVRHHPDYPSAYNNLGVVLSETGAIGEAIACYRKAQKLDPNFAEPFYNLHALLVNAEDLKDSIACLEKAFGIQPENHSYRFFLGMLNDYAGHHTKAAQYFELNQGDALFQADLDAWRFIQSSQATAPGTSLPGKFPLIQGTASRTFHYALQQAKVDGLVLEFGVFNGKSIRQIAALVDGPVHGFDSFEGIPEDWNHESSGSYSTAGIIPDVPANVRLHAGWFEHSIPTFIEKESGPIRFMNIDCDLYSSTKTVLDALASQIVVGTVIVFDEYIGNTSWREDEYKAFTEAAQAYGWTHEILSFSFVTKQVVIKITSVQ
jgi:tetratricopeptide (TPR) repeat protein